MGDPDFELVATIPSACVLGEGPVWDARIGVLWFTDIKQRHLLLLDWRRQNLQRFELPLRLGSLGLTADPGRLICALESGFAFFSPTTGRVDWVHKTEPVYRGIRMNDGRVDRQGRFWAGSMVEDPSHQAVGGGTLYRLDRGDGRAPAAMFNGIAISNSIAFSPTGDRVYFADSPTQEIRVFDCDTATGALGSAREFARLTGNAYPDGSDVDAAGRLWNAEWGSGRITAYRPDGAIEAQLKLPVSNATCVAFGGEDLDHLFVTTARDDLSVAQLAAEPLAGDLLIYKTTVQGLPAPIFAG